MIHHMGAGSSHWHRRHELFLVMLSPGDCLRNCDLLCRLSCHHRCEVLGMFPLRSGTHFFIAVYFVEGSNDLE